MISFPGDVQPARLGPDGDDPEHQPVDELRPQESFPERPEDQKKGKIIVTVLVKLQKAF